ncbi:MAG TPA: aminotransferase class IV [Bacteroidia bacterium]|nr:aminotransferase class IV [Bacteroidia bacterium]
MENTFVNLNGEQFDAKAPVLHADNRAFRYGDGVFESMRFSSGEVLFFDDHYHRLQSGMAVLGIKGNEKISPVNLRFHVHALIQANRIRQSARIRVEVFRNGEGTYTPDTDESSFLITVGELEDENFALNKEGLRIEVFPDLKKQFNVFSKYKTANSLLFVMAGLFMKKNNLDDCIILNESGNVCEANGSNIFMLKDGLIITPPLTDGCIDGVMRKNLFRILESENIQFAEQSIQPNALLTAEEIFFTNVSKGIRWVGAFKQKRFFNKFSQSLCDLLLHQAGEIKKV